MVHINHSDNVLGNEEAQSSPVVFNVAGKYFRFLLCSDLLRGGGGGLKPIIN